MLLYTAVDAKGTIECPWDFENWIKISVGYEQWSFWKGKEDLMTRFLQSMIP
jgi:hypothetical protein